MVIEKGSKNPLRNEKFQRSCGEIFITEDGRGISTGTVGTNKDRLTRPKNNKELNESLALLKDYGIYKDLCDHP